jgi:quercetin dioxygenase-like cupin family protein
MRRSLSLIVAFLLGGGVSTLLGGGVSALMQSSKDAVAVDPTHHHVIMENPRVRVFEVLAAPGDKSSMHTHPPLVAVSLSKARLRMTTPDGKSSIFDLHPAQVLWMENVEHSWELLAGQVHLVAVEVKGR